MSLTALTLAAWQKEVLPFSAETFDLSLFYTECLAHNRKLACEEQTAEADPEMTQMVELPDRDFKITLMNVLKGLVEKGDNMHEHMGQRDGNY